MPSVRVLPIGKTRIELGEEDPFISLEATGDLSETRAKLADVESKLAAATQKTNELQNTLWVVMTSGGIVIVVLLVAVFVLASAKPMA